MRVYLLTAVLGLTAIVPPRVPAPRAAVQPLNDTLAIEHATIIPMDRDTALVDQTIIAAGGRIVWLGPAAVAKAPASAQRVDGRGKFVMPGLADMHVHLQDVAELPRYVATGITTVRNMRGLREQVEWRDRVNRGELVGPRIFTTGPICCGSLFTRGGFVRLRTAEQVDREIDRQARERFDMVKVHSRLRADLYPRLMARARAHQLPVVGHVIEEVGWEATIAAGQASIEHADMLGASPRPAQIAAQIARAGIWFGTIASGLCDQPSEQHRRGMEELKRAGVKLLAGSDATLGEMTPETALHCELKTLVTVGLTPYEALRTATANAGEFIKAHLPKVVEPFGTVTVGSRADLVMLSADPRQDLAALERPVGTVLRGRWLPR